MAEGTVLVIDDDPVIVKLLQVNFELEGYQVLTATDGEAGLRRAREDHPDIVVLDVMMPGMDGIEVAHRLRGEDETRALPILLLSAKAQGSDIAEGEEVADGYVTKPFDSLDLLDRVAALLPSGSRLGGRWPSRI